MSARRDSRKHARARAFQLAAMRRSGRVFVLESPFPIIPLVIQKHVVGPRGTRKGRLTVCASVRSNHAAD